MIGRHQKGNFDSPWIIPFMSLFFLIHAKFFYGTPTLRTNNLALPSPLQPLPAVGALPPLFLFRVSFPLAVFLSFFLYPLPPSSLFLIVNKFAFLSWLLFFFLTAECIISPFSPSKETVTHPPFCRISPLLKWIPALHQ